MTVEQVVEDYACLMDRWARAGVPAAPMWMYLEVHGRAMDPLLVDAVLNKFYDMSTVLEIKVAWDRGESFGGQ